MQIFGKDSDLRSAILATLAFVALLSLWRHATRSGSPLVCHYNGATVRDALDLGTHYSGVPVTATFTLHNHSTAKLRILAVRASCSCLSVEEAPEAIAPGGREELSLVWKISRTQPRLSATERIHEKKLVVDYGEASSAKAQSMTLTLRASIEPPITTKLDKLVIERECFGQEVLCEPRFIELFCKEDVRLLYASAEPEGDVSVEIVKRGECAELMVQPAKAQGVCKGFSGKLNVHYSIAGSDARDVFSLPLSVVPILPVEITNDDARHLGIISLQGNATVTFNLVSGQPFAIKSVSSESGACRWKVDWINQESCQLHIDLGRARLGTNTCQTEICIASGGMTAEWSLFRDVTYYGASKEPSAGEKAVVGALPRNGFKP